MIDQMEIVANGVEDDALQWLVDFDNLSQFDQERLTQWLGKRPGNADMFAKMDREWRKLDVLRQLATDSPDPNVVNQWVRKRRRHRRFLSLAAAAAVAAIATVGLLSAPSYFEAKYQTAVGEHREVVLPDDSVITLNTDSRVTVHYSGDERRVRLERGEVHFDIKPVRERPFSVLAGAGTVRAVGTAFNVYLKDGVVEVTVTEGVVEVLPKALPAAQRDLSRAPVEVAIPVPEMLGQGQKLEYRDTIIESVSRVAPREIARQLAWQDGMLDFQGETLVEVIEEASRYTSTRITIEDPELEGLHVTARFKVGDVDRLCELIESNYNVTVRRVAPQVVQIITTPLLNQ